MRRRIAFTTAPVSIRRWGRAGRDDGQGLVGDRAGGLDACDLGRFLHAAQVFTSSFPSGHAAVSAVTTQPKISAFLPVGPHD